MNGLGDLNKSSNGIVLGMVQLQVPIVTNEIELSAQTRVIVDRVASDAAE